MTVDPFTILEHDHRQVERLLEGLGESDPGDEREAMLAELEQALEVHMAFEEGSVYPIVREELGVEDAEEATIEHGLGREGMAKLRELVDLPGFGAAVEMVKGGISHHVEEEEGEMFPALRSKVDAATRDRLTDELLAAKASAGMAPMSFDDATKDEMIDLARRRGVDVRAHMTKDEVRAALGAEG